MMQILPFLIVCLATCWCHGDTPPVTTKPADESSPFGIVFDVPQKWVEQELTAIEDIARWESHDGDQVISLTMSWRKDKSIDDYVAKEVARLNASISKAPASFASKAAVKLIDGKRLNGAVYEVLIVQEGAYFYSLSGQAFNVNRIPRQEMESLAATARFTPISSPIDGRKPGKSAMTVLNTFTWVPLQGMRPSPIEPMADAFTLDLVDYRKCTPAMSVTAQVGSFGKEIKLSDLQGEFPKRNGVPRPRLVWRNLQGVLEATASDAVEMPVPNGRTICSFALIRLNDSKIAILTFQFDIAERADVPKYYESAIGLVMSIRPLESRR